MMKETELNKLVEKLLTGTCTDDESKQLEEWFSSFDDSNANEVTEKLLDKQALKMKLFTRIENQLTGQFKEDTKIVPLPGSKMNRLKIMGLVAAAAACLLLMINVYFFKTAHFRDPNKTFYKELMTKMGQTTRIRLQDGSIVWLNSGSRLIYPVKFGGDKREVFLSGEAFFEVHHEDTRSFIVHSGEIITEDIGTSFNIKAFPRSNENKITVITGKVKTYPVATENKVTYKDQLLNAGQSVTFNTITNTASVAPTDRNIANWRLGGLCFDNESLATVACQLENHFGLKITFQNDEIKSMKFSGLFTSAETINQILYIIGKADRIQIKKNGTLIYFYTNKNADRTP